MSVRPTLNGLITALRGMVNDPAGAAAMFSDDDIAAALDANRVDVRQMELAPAYTIVEGGAVQYLDYFAPYGAWELGEVLQNSRFATLTPASAEPLVGAWHFGAHQPSPVYLTGRVYDLAATAADVLEMKLGKAGDRVDFSVDGLSVNQGSAISALQRSISRFRFQQRVGAAKLVRNDER